MKLLFDCDVVIDILGKSEDFFASYTSFDVAVEKGFSMCVTVPSLVNINYVLAARKYLDKSAARKAIGTLFELFDILDVSSVDCRQAHQSEMDDFEDALIASTAKRCGVDFIITRNKKGYRHSPVPALTPKEFVDIYKPDYLDYAMVDL